MVLSAGPAMPVSLVLRRFDCPCSGPCRGAESSVRTKTLVKPSHCSCNGVPRLDEDGGPARSEEHTSELQSLMRISYAVFCLKKKRKKQKRKSITQRNTCTTHNINQTYNKT